MNVNYDELILLAGGAFLVVWGNWKKTERTKLLSSGIKAEGTVIEIKTNPSSNNVSVGTPVIKFETLNNEWITKEYGFGSSTLRYKIGDSVDVIYDASDAKHFIIDNRQTQLLGPVVMSVGLALIIGAIIYFIVNQYPSL